MDKTSILNLLSRVLVRFHKTSKKLPRSLQPFHDPPRRERRITRSSKMGVSFDHAPKRPEHIENILNGLDRYNPETTMIFQDYVQQQCEEGAYDSYANLALLKL